MDHKGSVHFAVMILIFVGAMLVLGTSVSIHQINQKKVIHASKIWEALWTLKTASERWKMGLETDQGKEDFIVEQRYLSAIGDLTINEVSTSWKEGDQSKKISLIVFKPVIP